MRRSLTAVFLAMLAAVGAPVRAGDDDGKDVPRKDVPRRDAVVTIAGLAAGVTTAYVTRLPGSRAVEVRVPLRDGETREVIVPSFPR